MEEQDQRIINANLSIFYSEQKHALLSALAALPTVDVVNIFHEFISEAKRLHMSPKNPHLKVQWVYLTCKRALLPIRLLESYNSYLLSEISEYCMWLQLDAVSTRAFIHEACQSLHQARIDLQLIVRMIKSYPNPIGQMAKSCRSIVLFAACRLPLLETHLQMYSEALASYRLCISGDQLNPAPLAEYYSIPLQIALSTFAAELILMRAYAGHLENQAICHSELKSNGGTHHSPDDEILQIETAFQLLSFAQQLMSKTPILPQTTQQQENPENFDFTISLPSSSMQRIVSNWAEEFVKVFDRTSSGRIAVSLTAVEVCLQYTRSRNKRSLTDALRPIRILEWGLLSDPRPTLELLWNLGVFYALLGSRIEEGIDILRQCIPLTGRLTNPQPILTSTPGISHTPQPPEDLDSYHRRGLLSWLGLGPQPGYELQHLPSLLAAQLSLNVLGNPEKALLCAHEGLRELFLGEDYFERELENFVNEYLTPTKVETPEESPQSSEFVNRLPHQPRGLGSFFSKESTIYHSVAKTSLLNQSPKSSDDQKKILESDIIETTESSSLNVLANAVTSLVLVIARSYASWARNFTLLPAVGPESASFMRNKTIGIFKFLLSQEFYSALRISPSSASRIGSLLAQSESSGVNNQHFMISTMDHMNFCVEYAIVLAETGDISLAIELLRKYLVDMGHDHDVYSDQSAHVSPVLHLLSILLTCTKGDEQVAIVGLQLCSESLCLSKAKSEKNRNRTRSLSSSHYSPLFDNAISGYLFQQLKIDLSCATDFPSRIYHTSDSEILNLKYTLARIKWSMGEKETALRLIDDIVAPLLNRRQDELVDIDLERERYSSEPISFLSLQLRVRLLIGASQLYRLVNNDVKTQVCVEEAWRAIFSFSPSIKDPRLPKGFEFTGLPGQNDVIALLWKKRIERPLAMPLENTTAKLPLHSDDRWLDILRRVPTIPGWRLPEACGWGCRLPQSCLAEVLAECAEIVSSQGKVETSLELLQISISLYPQHIRTLLCLAELELSLHEESIALSKKDNLFVESQQIEWNSQSPPTQHLVQAYQYAQTAVNYNQLNPHGWFVVYRVLLSIICV